MSSVDFFGFTTEKARQFCHPEAEAIALPQPLVAGLLDGRDWTIP